jgi:hypothetical protein
MFRNALMRGRSDSFAALERMERRVPFKLDDEVHIAAFAVEIAARGRTKKIESPYTEATANRPQFFPTKFNLLDHADSAPTS